jgi:hypothetical protein
VLTDREDRPARVMGGRDRSEAVIGACGQIDEDPVDLGEGGLETFQGPGRQGDRIRTPNDVGQAAGPDQIVGQDGDASGQSRASAR